MPQTISSEQFSGKLKSGVPCYLLDVRTYPEYREIHLASSCTHIPLDELDPEKLKTAFPDPSRPLFVLCKAGRRSAAAAEKLEKAGFKNATVVEGGLDACLSCNVPVSRGEGVIPLERQVRIAAGTLMLTGIVFGALAHPAFYLLSAFVAAGLIYSGISGWCGMGMLLAKAPWNK